MSDAFEEFGPYLVYERLGQGGMATVHRAEKRGTGIRRPIALKRLLPQVATDPALIKLFVDEARLASRLHHANVAQTYELGKVGDTFFIAMEYASGPTLAQIVRQCQAAVGDIPVTVIVNVLSQVCEALDYAHNLCDETGQPLRIIHRDVSPANIIVTSTGIVKLIDFGIAKATISSVKTQTGFIKGKFGYIAPEYLTGRIDARVDLFAVGVVAHEVLAGRRLFEGKDDFETLQNIREMELLPPSHYNPHVTPDLDDIVMTALQRDPADRWQSAGAMQVALTNVAREFGLVVGGQQLAEWVDWAFSQVPPDSGPLIRPGGRRAPGFATGETHAVQRPAPDPDSSLSIRVERVSAGALDGLARPEPTTPPQPLAAGEPSLAPARLPQLTPPLQLTPPPVQLTPPPQRLPQLTPPLQLTPPPVQLTPPPQRLPQLTPPLQLTPPPQLTPAPEPMPPPRQRRSPSDFDETAPVERIELSRRDIELLTPSPELAPPPPPILPVALAPPVSMPRSSRTHDAVAAPPLRDASPVPPPIPPPRAEVAAGPPPIPPPIQPPIQPRASRPQDVVAPSPLPVSSPRGSRPQDAVAPSPLPVSSPRGSRPQDALAPPPLPVSSPRASRPQDAVAPPPLPASSSRELGALGLPAPVSPSRELDAVPRRALPSSEPGFLSGPSAPPRPHTPPGAMLEAPILAPSPGATHASRARPRSTQKTRPQPRSALGADVPTTGGRTHPASRARRNVWWLVLLMIALGGGAMAAAYYWPDL